MTDEQIHVPQSIAGIWRRIGAFMLDGLVLGLFGLISGWLLIDQLVAMGPWGRLFGFAIALAYFGLLNSRLGGGQTVGKRLLGIKVVGADGATMAPLRSLVRFLPLGAVWFLNGAQFAMAVLRSPWMYLFSIAVFGLGFAIVYLFLFNRRTRQSLHDLLVGSYVVRTGGSGAVPAPSVWRPHLVVCLVLLAAAVVLPIFTMQLMSSEPFASMMKVHQIVSAEPDVVHVNVFKGESYSPGETSTFLRVIVNVDSRGAMNEARARRVAVLVLETDATIRSLDFLQISVVYGFDIGIANSWLQHSSTHRPSEWLSEAVPSS